MALFEAINVCVGIFTLQDPECAYETYSDMLNRGIIEVPVKHLTKVAQVMMNRDVQSYFKYGDIKHWKEFTIKEEKWSKAWTHAYLTGQRKDSGDVTPVSEQLQAKQDPQRILQTTDFAWLGPELTPEKPVTQEKGYNVYLCTPYLEGVPINRHYGPDDFVTPQQLTPQPSTSQGVESPLFEPMKNVTGVKELGGDSAAMAVLCTLFSPSAGHQPKGSVTPLQKKIVEMVISAQQ